MSVIAVAEYPEMSPQMAEKSPALQVLVVDEADGRRFDVVLLDYRLPDSNDLRLLDHPELVARQRRHHDDGLRHAGNG